MKEFYTAPELDITLFASDDVITTSVTPESDEMPIAQYPSSSAGISRICLAGSPEFLIFAAVMNIAML